MLKKNKKLLNKSRINLMRLLFYVKDFVKKNYIFARKNFLV